ncbi:hypothetical protein CDL12_08401 [Handroanthus impetiginosus]|uniref:Uncharacterized protein n=1 Tax=Handroanthus impetiginosus TaxID=429701 RepID=A0A2G9HN42_9LAMI|nr:hypothetical protein CDL12_08401 [Handroanthus impetiginosus]
MADGSTSEGFNKSRSVLGDLTNRLGKREFSGSGIKSFISNDRAKRIRFSPSPCAEISSLKGNVASSIAKVPDENREPNVPDFRSGFVVLNSSIHVEADCDVGKDALMGNSKVHCRNEGIKNLDLSGGIVVSKSVNELDDGNDLDDCGDIGSFQGDEVAILNSKGLNLTDLEGGRALNSVAIEAVCCGKLLDLSKENETSGIAETVSEPKFGNPDRTVIGNVVDITIYGDNEVAPNSSNALQPILGDSFVAATSRTVSETGGDCLNESKDFDCDKLKASLGGNQSDINDNQNNEDDHNADNLGSQCGSIDCVILPESQESRIFGVDRSTERNKGDECDNMSGGTDSIKTCTCSFCTKAAHMWLDLNYQDIKARISATKKSQKEASILAERSIKVIEKNVAENFTRVYKLESDLMYQWRSLFQHMADTWEQEGNQLEARLLPLADLREKCKTDMESTSTTLSENH